MDKEILKQMCLDNIENRKVKLQDLIDEVQASSNNETKSTAGDKHDTARAQAQIEVERLSKQLGLLNTMHNEILRLPTQKMEYIQIGSYISTKAGNFYVSAALGKMDHDGESYFAISVNSPIYVSLRGKLVGEDFEMVNGAKHNIIYIL